MSPVRDVSFLDGMRAWRVKLCRAFSVASLLMDRMSEVVGRVVVVY